MRKTIAIVLLAILAGQATGSYWIMAAFYLNRDYIAKNLCVNRFELIPVCKGSCFLEKKLGESAHSHDKAPDTKTIEITLYPAAEAAAIRPVFVKYLTTNYPVSLHSHLLSGFTCTPLRPPDC